MACLISRCGHLLEVGWSNERTHSVAAVSMSGWLNFSLTFFNGVYYLKWGNQHKYFRLKVWLIWGLSISSSMGLISQVIKSGSGYKTLSRVP